MNTEKRLAELKLELPPAPKPVAVYGTVVVAGNLAHVSGHGPLKSDGTMITGRVALLGMADDGEASGCVPGYFSFRQLGLLLSSRWRPQCQRTPSVLDHRPLQS